MGVVGTHVLWSLQITSVLLLSRNCKRLDFWRGFFVGLCLVCAVPTLHKVLVKNFHILLCYLQEGRPTRRPIRCQGAKALIRSRLALS